MAYQIGQVVVTNSQSNYRINSDNNEYEVIDKVHRRSVGGDIEVFTGGRPLSHIGVQSSPGAVFMIGEEIIVIGRSGTYELSNELIYINTEEIYLLSANTFIIDFKY